MGFMELRPGFDRQTPESERCAMNGLRSVPGRVSPHGSGSARRVPSKETMRIGILDMLVESPCAGANYAYRDVQASAMPAAAILAKRSPRGKSLRAGESHSVAFKGRGLRKDMWSGGAPKARRIP